MALSLLVPALYVPIMSGAALACVACLVAVAMLPPRLPSTSSDIGVTGSATVPRLLLHCLVASALSLSAHGSAAQETASTPAEPPTAHKVIIPVEKDRAAKAARYYLTPEPLYTDLRRRAAEIGRRPDGWLLERASYRATLGWAVLQRGLRVTELTAAYDFWVFGQTKSISLPLGEGLAVLPERALLDGTSVELTPDVEKKRVLVNVDTPGQHRLELSLQPAIQMQGSAYALDVAIPPLHRSTLDLVSPAEGPPVETIVYGGAVVATDEDGHIDAELGPASQLQVRWHELSAGQAAVGTFDAEELLWLKVQPGSVLLEAKLRLNVTDGSLRQIKLAVDPRLRLLTSGPQEKRPYRLREIAGDPSHVELEFPRPVTESTLIELQFLLTGASGLGNLRLPQFEVLDARRRERSLAVSIDASLDRDQKMGSGLNEVAAQDFVARWGQTETQPDFAYALAADEPDWSVATRPREPQTSGSQALSLTVGGSQVAVRYEASLATASGPVFQRRLQVPADFAVEELQVIEEGGMRNSRWSRNDPSTMHIFLREPAAGAQTIVIKGMIPLSTDGLFGLPIFRMEGVPTQPFQVQVYRQPDVLVDVKNLQGMQAIEDAGASRPQDSVARLVGAFQIIGEGGTAQLACSQNLPVFTATEVLEMKRQDAGGWQAAMHYHVRVEQGLLDELRFAIDPQWQGPFEAEPAANIRVTTNSTGESRELVVQPRSPIQADYQITIRGRLAAGESGRVEAPAIKARAAKQLKRYVLLPIRHQLEEVHWDTAGWMRTDLPKELEPSALPPETYSAYEAIGRQNSATLRKPGSVSSQPVVRLADYQVTWNHGETFHGIATFDLDSFGAGHVVLRTPPQIRLVSGTLDELNLILNPLKKDRWRIELGSQVFPQRLQLMFVGQLRSTAGKTAMTFAAPTLEDVTVDKTLWTIFGPSQAGTGASLQLSEENPLRLELARAQHIAELLGSSVSTTAVDAETLALWRKPWSERLNSHFARIRWLMTQTPDIKLARLAERELSRLAPSDPTAASGSTVNAPASAQSPSDGVAPTQVAERLTDQPPQISEALLQGDVTAYRGVHEGPLTAVRIRYAPPEQDDFQGRLWLAVLIILAGALAGLIYRNRAAMNMIRNWPYVPAFSAGLFWWMWLSPSIVGLLIMLASLVLFARALYRLQTAGEPVIEVSSL
jgi:hypothetical protein